MRKQDRGRLDSQSGPKHALLRSLLIYKGNLASRVGKTFGIPKTAEYMTVGRIRFSNRSKICCILEVKGQFIRVILLVGLAKLWECPKQQNT